RPRSIATGAVRGDERDEGHDAGICEEPGDLGHPADVLVAIVGRETEVAVQAVPQVVTVEHVARPPPGKEQPLDLERDRRLAGSRRPGDPDRRPAEAGRLPPLVSLDEAVVPDRVGAGRVGHWLAPRIMPAATVLLLVSSMSTKLPVSRLRR